MEEKCICGSYAYKHVLSLSLVLNVCDATTGSYLGVVFKGTGIAKPHARIKAVMHYCALGHNFREVNIVRTDLCLYVIYDKGDSAFLWVCRTG